MMKRIMFRETCLFCVSKHISQAIVLMQEAYAGYPIHRWLAVGHLGEAEAESQHDFPILSQCIRETRCRLMSQETSDGCKSLMSLLTEVRTQAEKINGYSDETMLEGLRCLME